MQPSKKTAFLVVDDDFVSRKTEMRILHDMGFSDVHQAESGTEAWPLIKQVTIDFVIAAWEMPEMNGLALLKLIRTDLERNNIPVILLVEEITRSQVVEAGEAGVTDLMVHPLTADIFKRKVEGIMSIKDDPRQVEVEKNYEQGKKLMKNGNFDEALTSFKRILSVYESAEIYYNMGYINTSQGKYSDALLNFRKATEIDNAFARAHKMMGEALIKLGRKEEAQEALQKAADIYMDKNMDKNAEEILQAVAELNPSTINVYNSLGILYRRQKKYDKAVKQYNKALKVAPEDENIYYNLSRVYLVMKDFTKAREALVKAVTFNPDFNEAKELIKSIDQGLKNK